MSRLATLLVFALPACGQPFRFGAEAGVPISDYFETGVVGNLQEHSEDSAATRRYTVGAAAEWNFTHAFGLEVDVMYHRMDMLPS